MATALAGALPGLAIAAILANAQPVVMPTRRREFDPGYDLNELLDDAGKRAERKARKAEWRGRLRAAQRAAVEGRP